MKQKLKSILALPLAGFFLTVFSSCHWVQNSSSSIIVIAVDQLGVNQISCTPENPSDLHSGIGLLCQESIRFTHAYTPSLLSGPALASILTGLYPFQHGLRSNTKSFLSGRVTTVPELAQQKGMVTSFFSGGAPVLRKLNLQQGFETFDDVFTPNPTTLFRPFSRTQKIFETWIQEARPQGFFSVFYVPDLAYLTTPTQTDLGETRDFSFESQFEEFDESLYTFIQSLKSRGVWDSSMVVLVGLNGPDLETRSGELPNLNLFSERTQVGLLIKPPQKPRDQGINWSYDENVSLVDLGATLLEPFRQEKPDAFFPAASLSPILQSPSPVPPPDRPLLLESAWSESAAIRFAVRWGQYLFLLDERPRVFNSLIDKLETTSLKVSESTVRGQWERIEKIVEQYGLQLWTQLPHEHFLKWFGYSEIWDNSGGSTRNVSYERLAHRLKNDEEVTRLYSRELLQTQNWEALERWSLGMKISDLERVAKKNLKKDTKRKFQDPCLFALEMAAPQIADLKKCNDPLAFTLLEWTLRERADPTENPAKESLRKKFLRQYILYRLDQQIADENQALQGIWDLAPSLKNRPLTLEMMLALPDMQKFRQAAVKAFAQFKDNQTNL